MPRAKIEEYFSMVEQPKTSFAMLSLAYKISYMLKYSQETFACRQGRLPCGTMRSRATQRRATHDEKGENT